MTERIKERTVKSVRVTLVATVVMALMQAVLLVVMARMLRPADYGIVAAGMIIIRPLQVIVFSGLERAILLTCRLTKDVVATMTVMNTAIGLAASMALAILSQVGGNIAAIAPYLHMLLALAPLPLIFGIGVTARAHLRQNLEYDKLAKADLISLLISGLVQLLTVWLGWGAYSLAVGYAVQAVLLTAINIHSSAIYPRLFFSFSLAKPTLLASFAISKSTVLEVLSGNLPAIFIGGLIGPIALGLYNRAYVLIQMPVELLMNSMSRVLFSSFNLVSDDIERLRRGCRSLIQVGGGVTVPIAFAAAAAAPDVVGVLLGRKWSAAADLMPYICIGTSFSMLAHLIASMNEATKRFEERFHIQLLTTAATCVALFIARPWGLIGFSAAFAFGSLVFFLANLVLGARVMQTTPQVLFRWSLASLSCGAILAVVAATIRFVGQGLSLYLRFSLEVIACILVQLLFYAVFWRGTLREIVSYSGLHLPAFAVRLLERNDGKTG